MDAVKEDMKLVQMSAEDTEDRASWRHMTGCDHPLRKQPWLVEEDSGNSSVDINEMHIKHEKYIVVC